MQRTPNSRSQSRIQMESEISSPQVKIYNRHFYLRQAEHDLIKQQYQKQLKRLSNTPKISVSSYNILSAKLQRNIFENITYLIMEKNSKQNKREIKELHQLEKYTFDFRQLQNLLLRLIGISEEKAGVQIEHFESQLWLVLVKYQLDGKTGINTAILYSVIRILFDPYNLTIQQLQDMLQSLQQFQQAKQRRRCFLQQYADLEEQTLTILEILKLWKKIRYENPHFTTIQQHKQQQNKYLTFKPEVNAKSRQLAEESFKKYLSANSALNSNNIQQPRQSHKHTKTQNQLTRYLDHSSFQHQPEENNFLPKVDYHEMLYRRKLKKDELCPIKIDERQTSYVKNSRVGRPEEIKEIVNNLYVVKPKREDVDWEKIKEEQQLQKCTFSPKINKDHTYYSSNRSISPNVYGYENQIKRMEKGRKQKERKKQAYQNLGRVKNAHRYSSSKSPRCSASRKSDAPSFLSRDAPKLILQINIDGNRIEKLSLKGDQNPRFVAKKFAIMHGLEDNMIQVLEQLIAQQLLKL